MLEEAHSRRKAHAHLGKGHRLTCAHSLVEGHACACGWQERYLDSLDCCGDSLGTFAQLLLGDGVDAAEKRMLEGVSFQQAAISLGKYLPLGEFDA